MTYKLDRHFLRSPKATDPPLTNSQRLLLLTVGVDRERLEGLSKERAAIWISKLVAAGRCTPKQGELVAKINAGSQV